jgi:hypothetical protein
MSVICFVLIFVSSHLCDLQVLAEDGALILGERLRLEAERSVVREVLAKVREGWLQSNRAHRTAIHAGCIPGF